MYENSLSAEQHNRGEKWGTSMISEPGVGPSRMFYYQGFWRKIKCPFTLNKMFLGAESTV
jgi:hypothetical protein